MNRNFVRICLVLVGLLATQLVIRWDPSTPDDIEGPEILRSGLHLSEVAGGVLKGLMVTGCSPVYFVDPLCPGCSVLAETWKTAGRPPGTWVISREADVATAFATKHGISSADVVFLADIGGIAPHLRELGVFASPTTAVLDSLGILRHVRGGPRPVPDEVLGRYCK